ncbi:MAG TPA: non-ribosomal peptide synthetase, partial [Eubacterium sp.]|nr:non-ribosomal peptide synthetase [Eubacterium sp.]
MAVVSNKIENVYPLTPLQEGMLFHHLANPNSAEYIMQHAYNVDMELNTENIKRALALLSVRYSALRTAFAYKKTKEIYQVVLAEREIEYNFISLVNDDKKDDNYKKILANDLNRGFDLIKDSLLRVTHVQFDEKVNKLVFSFHHIIVDGWCIGIVIDSFWKYYNSLSEGISYDELLKSVVDEKSKSSDYSEYIKWLNKQDKEKAGQFWAKELEGYDSDAKIESLHKPERTNEQVRELIGYVDQDNTEKLKMLSKNNEATINTVAEVAVGILLQRYSASDDVVYGKVVSGRNVPINGIEKMVGLFINTIPVRVSSDDNTTVGELIRTQQEKGIESTEFEYYSLAEIQNNTMQGSNLINVIFVYENYMSGQNANKDGEKNDSIYVEYVREQTNYNITISATEIDGKLGFEILYNPNQYSDLEAKFIMDRLLKICEQMAKDSEIKVSDIDAINEDEKALIVNEFSNTKSEYPVDKTVV